MTTADKVLLSIPEAAERLSVSEATAERLIFRRELASVKVGRRRLVAVADLQAYVDSLREQQA